MVPIEQSEWCNCSPRTVVDGVGFPPKDGEGRVTETESTADVPNMEHSPDSLEDTGVEVTQED